MTPDWSEDLVVDALSSLLSEEEVTLLKDYDDGRVVLKADDVYRLRPVEAHRLADGYEEALEEDDSRGVMQTELLLELLRKYADAVEPYADDATEE